MIRSAWFPLLLGALALAACGNDDDLVLPEPEPTPTPTLQLALSQPAPLVANLGVTQGGAGGATVTRSQGFNGAVTMSAEGVPTGWSISFSPAILGADITESTVLITAPANVMPGSYSFTVRATAVGITTTSAAMSVTANVGQAN